MTVNSHSKLFIPMISIGFPKYVCYLIQQKFPPYHHGFYFKLFTNLELYIWISCLYNQLSGFVEGKWVTSILTLSLSIYKYINSY